MSTRLKTEPAGARETAQEDYEAKHLEVLRAATTLFAERGFHRTSIRELARATGRSLAGLYYYFSGKEELLFQIQHHCYGTLLKSVRQALRPGDAPRQRLVTFISHHIGYFRNNMEAMQVLAHEDLTLDGDYGRRLLDLKRRYSRELVAIMKDLGEEKPQATPDPETAAFVLFGMMNWLYTWPRKLKRQPAEKLAEVVAQVFLCGYPGCPASTLEAMRQDIDCSSSQFWDGSIPPQRSES